MKSMRSSQSFLRVEKFSCPSAVTPSAIGAARWKTNGLSWQVILAGEHGIQQRIIPVFMFVGGVCGKTEEPDPKQKPQWAK